MNLSGIKSVINQIYTILNKGQRKRGVVILFMTLLGSVFEMLGVTIIVPFITAILDAEALMNNQYMRVFVEIFNIKNSISLIILASILLVLVYLFKNIFLTIFAYKKYKYQCHIQEELSVYILNSYENRPYTFFLNTNSGDIFRGVTNDITGVYSIIDNIFKLIAESITILLISITIFAIDWTMAVSVALFAGISMGIIYLLFSKSMKRFGVIQQKMMALKYKDASQAINGIKDIKVMHREENFVSKYANTIKKQMDADRKYYFAGSCPERLIETICVSGIIGMVTIKIIMGVDVAVFIPSLAALAIAAFRILPSVSKMSGYINGIIYFRPTLQSTYENVLEARKFEIEKEINTNEEKEQLKFEEGICIDNISWHYPEQQDDVLHELSLTIQKGDSIGLIGASGAGKTTLGDLILGLYKPQKGDIKVDGKSIYKHSSEWSKMIGYVSQSVYLIDDTIRNNITFGIDEVEISDEKIWKALEQAQLSDFVRNLPEQLDAVVGERGVKMSGGQRQRIAIARALYYNPPILVLDEATSALDNETEKAVMESIEYLQHYKTMIIIAHRLTTIETCDYIYEIKDGSIFKC